ncbi:MAG TPA: TIM barrel protein [Bryobacteraceae bacterium]|nr:TIM barrel protein [Bryobacteraceae bacterium]
MILRRSFLTATTLPLVTSSRLWGAKIDSRVKGVRIGVQSYSFRDRGLDEAIEAMKTIGLGEVELWQGHIEPGRANKVSREALREWRLSTPMSLFEGVRKKFDDAGILLYAYNYSFREDFTDKEIERGFDMAKALGIKVLTASSNVTTARRIDPFAKKAKVRVGMHNHSRIHENEFATPEDFAKAMDGMSEYLCVNLDIGHFTAANFDAVDYLAKNASKIVTLHLKDRKKDQGANVPFGEGDTPIKAVLNTLKNKKLKIPANIEYEYKGADTVEEVKKCFEYCKAAID